MVNCKLSNRQQNIAVGACIARPISAHEYKQDFVRQRTQMIHVIVGTGVLDGPNNETIFIV